MIVLLQRIGELARAIMELTWLRASTWRGDGGTRV